MSITAKPIDFSTMFLDMNSFFASVEQQVQPTLRGIPLGVAPYTGNTGCIIAASKEAKALGIKICQVGEAKKICPKIKIVEARPALYMLYHREIKKVIESFTPYFEAMSIDEFTIRLTPQDQSRERAEKLAIDIKRAIRERVGDSLTCSIGIGSSTFLAKMAGERRKPDGLVILALQELEDFYAGLKLTDLTGINWRMEARLKNFGIGSPLSLYKLSLGELVHFLKHWGRLWYFRLRGYEVDSTGSPQVDENIISSKTIGHSHVLAPEFRSRSGALAILQKLIFKTGYRLRREGYFASGVAVTIGSYEGGSFSLSRKFPAFCDNNSIVQNAFELLKSHMWRTRPSYVAVSVFDLIPNGLEQISIFADIEKSKQLSRALDELNDEYGAETVFPASMFAARGAAPDRIPFGRPRYEIIH